MSCNHLYSGRKVGKCNHPKPHCTTSTCQVNKAHHRNRSKCENPNYLNFTSGSSQRKIHYGCNDELEFTGDFIRIDDNGDLEVGPSGGFLFYVESATGPTGPHIGDRIPVRVGDTFRIWSAGGIDVGVQKGSALTQLTTANIIVGPYPDPEPTFPFIWVNDEGKIDVVCPTDFIMGLSGASGMSGMSGTGGLTGAMGYQGTHGFQGQTGTQGPQGFQGMQGEIGSHGYIGDISDSCFDYIFSSNTTNEDPGTGNVRLNASVPSTTNIYIDNLDDNSDSIAAYMNSIKMNNNSIKGYVKIEKIGTNENGFYAINSIFEDTSEGLHWFDINVSYLSGSVVFVDSEMVQVCFARTSQKGDVGYTGAHGPQGSQAMTGFQGFQGFQGVTGFQGFQGFQCVTGFQGFQGKTGIVGESGSDGNTGTQGYMGAQGATGPQGEMGGGIEGATGLQGSQGATGVGEDGATGAPISVFNDIDNFNLTDPQSGDTIVFRNGKWINQSTVPTCETPSTIVITGCPSGPGDFITSFVIGDCAKVWGQVTMPLDSLTGPSPTGQNNVRIELPSDVILEKGIGNWSASNVEETYSGPISIVVNNINLVLPSEQVPISANGATDIPLKFNVCGKTVG